MSGGMSAAVTSCGVNGLGGRRHHRLGLARAGGVAGGERQDTHGKDRV